MSAERDLGMIEAFRKFKKLNGKIQWVEKWFQCFHLANLTLYNF
jgi:hypothetical protein